MLWLLVSWEMRQLFRFPILEAVAGLFVFFALGIEEGTGSQTLTFGTSWRDAASPLAAYSALGSMKALADLFVPAGIMGTIFAASAFGLEREIGYARILQAYPVTRAQVFFAKSLAIVIVLAVASILAVAAACLLVNRSDGDLVMPWVLPRLWSGVVATAIVFALVVSSLAIVLAVLIRSPSAAIATGVLVFVGGAMAGTRLEATWLPPRLFEHPDGLLSWAWGGPPNLALAAAWIALAALLGGIAFRAYRRQDVAS